jgi:hypothetical protein
MSYLIQSRLTLWSLTDSKMAICAHTLHFDLTVSDMGLRSDYYEPMFKVLTSIDQAVSERKPCCLSLSRTHW